MAKKKSLIRQVEYRVVNAMGLSEIGDIRVAFVIADDINAAMLFHPAARGECAAIEHARAGADGVYMSSSVTDFNGKLRAELLINSSLDINEPYVNLDTPARRVYEKIINDAGLTIPKKLLIRQEREPIEAIIAKAKEKAKKKKKRAKQPR